jgi:nitrite reductase/ring-hydroxylating ferredoxin subunit
VRGTDRVLSEQRRSLIRKGLRGGLYALAAALLAWPVFSFITFRKGGGRTVRFLPEERLAQVSFKAGAYLVRSADGDYAFSARCPHLGCTLQYSEASREFRCPCHGSIFNLSGRWLSGPARKDLLKITPVEGKAGAIEIRLES